jgi:photosynthetic reaction center cytochrome c subunit
MNQSLGIGRALGLVAIVFGSLLFLAMMRTWERPPMKSEQYGPDGLGLGLVQNPRTFARLAALNKVPEPQAPATPSGVKANVTYQNVQVLGDLDTEEFNRLMAAITEWVAPVDGENAGCAYCHNVENMAEDSVYQKVVARRMIQMTRNINAKWGPHVGKTGVTCYTCHRGQGVPANVWYKNDGPKHAMGLSASRQGGNVAGIGSTSLYTDPFTDLLAKGAQIRVVEAGVLPDGKTTSTQATEKTYSLMVHMSKGLGVNCTFCHNSRQFSDWSESRPQRVTAWHGIRMVSEQNADYLQTLKDVFPPNRKGPHGDVANINCTTCHQGVNKPLLGVSMVKDYPELAQPNP